MSRDRSSVVRVRAEVADAVRGLKDVASAAGSVGDRSEEAGRKSQSLGQRVAQSARDQRQDWQTVGAALTTYGAAVTGLGGVVLATGISYNSLRQTATAALTSVTGSTEGAAAQMQRLDDFGRNSWLMRDTLIRAQQQMTGFGISTERVIPYMGALAEAVAATGGNNQTFEELALVMGQIQSQGRITARELDRFGVRGVDAAQMIADAMGMTAGEIREQITSGALDADAALSALSRGMMMNFEGSSDLVRNTFRGAFDDVQAAFRDLSASFATPLVNPEGGGLLVDVMTWAADAMRAFEELPGPIRNTGIALGLATGPLGLLAGGFFLLTPRIVETIDAVGRLRERWGLLDRALRTARIGALPMAGLLGAASVAVFAWGQEAQRARGWTDMLAASFDEMGRATEGTSRALADLMADDPFSLLYFRSQSVFDAAETMGIAFDDLTGYVQGNQVAIDRVNASTDDYIGNSSLWDRATLSRQREVGNLMANLDGLADSLSEAERVELQKIQADFLAADSAREMAGGISESEVAAAEAAEAARALDEAWREMAIGASESFGGVMDAYNSASASAKEFSEDATASARDWISALQDQIAAHQNWEENIVGATERARDLLPAHMWDAADGMIDALIAGGMDSAEAAALLVSMTDAEFVELAELASQRGEQGGDNFADAVESARTPEVEIDDTAARSGFDELVDDFHGTTTDTHLDLNVNPADGEFANVTGVWDDTTTDTNLGLNDRPAEDEFASTTRGWRDTETNTLLGANPSLANEAFSGWRQNVRDARPTLAQVGANTSPARGDVNLFKSWAAGQSATITVRAFDQPARNTIASLSRSAAGGSYAYGGFTGDGGKFEPAGIVHRGEYVMPKEQTAVPAYRSILEAMHRGTLNLPGYANGGQVGTPVYRMAAPAAPNVTVQTPPFSGVTGSDMRAFAREVAVAMSELADGRIVSAASPTKQSLRASAGV